ncbi:MAG: hypothetical protein HZA54_17605 [Planctomycetes bacterium]|nr:hypothetical protein [Planctomycetota bacterium]
MGECSRAAPATPTPQTSGEAMIGRRFPFDVDLAPGEGSRAFLPVLVALVFGVALAATLDLGATATAILLCACAGVVVACLLLAWRRRLLRHFPPGPVGRYLRRARHHAWRGRFKRALACCERADELAPHSARVREERALVHLRMGEYEKGAAEFAAARAEDASRFRMYALAAAAQARVGDFAGAETGYRDALAHDAGDWTAWHGLGFALCRLGRREEAVAALRAGIDRCTWSDVLVPAAMAFLARLGKTPEAQELARTRLPAMKRRFWWRAATRHLLGDLPERKLARRLAWTREAAWRTALWFYLAERAAAQGKAERAREYRDRCVREGKAHESRGLACLAPEWGLALAESLPEAVGGAARAVEHDNADRRPR